MAQCPDWSLNTQSHLLKALSGLQFTWYGRHSQRLRAKICNCRSSKCTLVIERLWAEVHKPSRWTLYYTCMWECWNNKRKLLRASCVCGLSVLLSCQLVPPTAIVFIAALRAVGALKPSSSMFVSWNWEQTNSMLLQSYQQETPPFILILI